MNFSEKCKQCSVIVDNGSGVLFQPMTEEYSYILTVKHNLYNDKVFENYEDPKNIEDIKFTCYNETDKKNILAKYEHKTLDIAILKIDKINNLESPYKQFNQLSDRDILKLYGYPQNRRNEIEKIKYFDLKVGDISKQEIVAENDCYYTKSEVSGCSGGGVFKEEDEDFILVGIERRMDEESAQEENNSRVRFIPIQAFDEIIELNDELEPLYPPYMNDFNLLIDNIFLLTGLMVEKEKVTNVLKSIVNSHIKDQITPKQIFDKYNIGLLTKDKDKNELMNKELWIRYLEFLVLSYLIDTELITISQIDNIYKRRKILFAKTNDWTGLVRELLSYDIKSLEKNGTICIACDKDKTPNICEIPSGILKKINHIPHNNMQINDGLSNPIEDIKIQHIHHFQREFINKQASLEGLDIEEIEERITYEAKKIFK